MPSPFGGRWSLLAFGFAFAFFSSFGQTSFIAVFGGAIRDAFSLSNGAWGAAYFVATLTSGILITKVGAWIDAVPLRRYAMAAVAGLGVAALTAALASNVAMLIVALFLLRLFGQGLMTHVAATSMAREFVAARGRAIAIAMMGLPAGEAIFPALGALGLAHLGWRGSWLAAALLCFLVVLPLAPILLRRHGRDVATVSGSFGTIRFLLQKEMLLALPGLMAPGFNATAIAFHQVLIAETKGWSPAFFAGSFAVFGVSSIIAGLIAGWLVDRFSARLLARYYMLPMAVGCFALAAFDAPEVLFVYMVALGITAGAYGTVTISILAENYGLERLGAIRATAAAVLVVSTALSPLLFGVLVDSGVSVDILIATLGVISVAATIMLRLSALTKAPGD